MRYAVYQWAKPQTLDRDSLRACGSRHDQHAYDVGVVRVVRNVVQRLGRKHERLQA